VRCVTEIDHLSVLLHSFDNRPSGRPLNPPMVIGAQLWWLDAFLLPTSAKELIFSSATNRLPREGTSLSFTSAVKRWYYNSVYVYKFTVFCVVHRVAAVLAQSLCGRQVMVVGTVTAAVVTATQTVSTHCPSAVHQRMVLCLGTLNHVRPHWPQRTAAAARQNDKLYVNSVFSVDILVAWTAVVIFWTVVCPRSTLYVLFLLSFWYFRQI